MSSSPTAMTDDRELLQAWGAGDAGAGEALFHRYFESLHRFFKTKSPLHCEELLQSTFTACVEKRATMREGTTFRAFMYGVARFELMRFFRRKYRDAKNVEFEKAAVFDLDPTPSRAAAKKQEHRLLLEALRRIPVDLQIVVELHYWEDMATDEIAHVVGVPRGTVKSRLRRAREAVAEVLPRLAADPAAQQSTIHGFDDWAREIKGFFGPEKNP